MRSIFSLYSYELQPLLVWSADRLNIYYSIKSKLRISILPLLVWSYEIRLVVLVSLHSRKRIFIILQYLL